MASHLLIIRVFSILSNSHTTVFCELLHLSGIKVILEYTTETSTPTEQVLIRLLFIASENFQTMMGDLESVNKSSTWRH